MPDPVIRLLAPVNEATIRKRVVAHDAKGVVVRANRTLRHALAAAAAGSND